MLRRVVLLLAVAVGAERSIPAGRAAEPASVSDFKLRIALYNVHEKPVEAAEVVVRKGMAYHFVAGDSLEVIMIDPVNSRVELVDLDRKIRTELTFKRLEMFEGDLLRAITSANAKREKLGGRANKVAAEMSRNLIQPQFKSTYDASTHQLHLTNPNIEVEARGEPEKDQARLGYVGRTINLLTQLDSFRNPQGIPPFPKQAVLNALVVERQLCPSEMNFLYRLAGPPKRMRWTFHVEPKVTEREIEALARVDAVRLHCRPVPYEGYERTDNGE